MTATKAILHIGKHKTGTTSFQAYVHAHKKQLKETGVLVVPMNVSNFIAASIIRDQLPIPPLESLKQAEVNPSVEEALTKLANFVSDQNFTTLLLSCEHFSYFRQQAEIDMLKMLLLRSAQIKPSDVSICLVLRKPEQFLKSYTSQIIKTGHGKSNDKTSPYYCAPDSWLVDDAAIKVLWESNFRRLDILHYETGNTVIQLCRTMQLPKSKDIERYRFNKREHSVQKLFKLVGPSTSRKIKAFIKGFNKKYFLFRS